jgi:ABC-type lipoprotein release transport system permease subunit
VAAGATPEAARLAALEDLDARTGFAVTQLALSLALVTNAVLVTVVVIAAVFPARVATRIQPVDALRAE